MSLEPAAETTQCTKLTYREIAGACQLGVKYRCKVSCGEDECILTFCGASPGLRIVLHLVEIECGHHVGDAHGSARVTGLGGSDHPDDVSAYLGGNPA